MTDVNNCFPSVTLETTVNAVNAITTSTYKNAQQNYTKITKSYTDTSSFILKPPSINSKLILQNMEEVLNSMKRKHRQKHKRKKDKKRLNQLPDGVSEQSNTVTLAKAPDKMLKQPLREKLAQENGTHVYNPKTKSKLRKSPLKCSMPVAENASILKHFPRTPKKSTVNANANVAPSSDTKSDKLANAFELMMNARNRSIGIDPNIIDLETSPLGDSSTTALSPVHAKADRRGDNKRKLDEEARSAYVDQQLEQRAKRLKKMLTQLEETDLEVKSQTKTLKETTNKKSRRAHKRRINSVDSVDSIETVIVPDAETDEFLTKLNSTTKKHDSLLDYFSKNESSKQLTGKAINGHQKLDKEAPKRRTRGSSTLNKVNEEVAVIPARRPRRSCAGKTRYDYDLESSPTKSKTKTEDVSVEIIDLDSSNHSNTNIQTPKKLAPLFLRQMPKPSPDPSIMLARAEFLRSGVPDILKQEQLRQKQNEQYYECTYEFYPRVSHVRQLDDQEVLTTSPLKIKLLPADNDIMQQAVENHQHKSKSTIMCNITDCEPGDYQKPIGNRLSRNYARLNTLATLNSKRQIIKTWKVDFERFPTYKCYNQMCEKYRFFRAIDSKQNIQQVSESFVVTHSTRRSATNLSADEKPPSTAPNGELLFTEKYKPLLFEQVLVNLTPVQQLRDFLANWSGSSSSSNNGGGSNSNGNSSSNRNSQTFDESFNDYNDHLISLTSAVSNTMVLVGPSSSGKTNAVYALANDMNFNVLEINAGMRRTGKKLIQELLEATQSHQIRKDNKSSGQSKQLLKMSLNGLKARQRKTQQQQQQQLKHNQNDVQQGMPKSLILIEDADVVFEQTDAGFIDAIYTLAASSKRPVIIVATNPNCSHLQRLMQQNSIRFQSANVLNISKFLSVLALIENCPILLDDLISLYAFNNRNLRKTLLELQFFIQSGGDLRPLPTVELPATPQKCNKLPTSPNAATSYFASPSKRELTEAHNDQVEKDEQLVRCKTESSSNNNNSSVYMHHTLFEFYTCAQNQQYRIPFPIDFRLLRINFSDLLSVSLKLLPEKEASLHKADATETNTKLLHNKRKTRSPKKTWLINSASNNSNSNSNSSSSLTSLAILCAFYDNVSVAAMLSSCDAQNCGDRLLPHLSEQITHTLIEQALDVNLAAQSCPYNLFDTPQESYTLCEQLSGCQLRTKRARALDYEPILRAICRSEKQRAGSERRSSRFYHYLRNSIVNTYDFSMERYDAACGVLQEEKPPSDECDTTRSTST